MFCKVCYDASKTTYNNHNVRDYHGNVICPLLLNTKCNKCGYFGHTVKYCKYKSINTTIKMTNSSTIKSVKFGKDVKSYSLVQKNINTTNRFSFCDFDIDYDHEIDDDDKKFDGIDEEFDLTSIVWGVGHYDMIGVLWVDACS